ncbi:MAG TPA: hypothetical protein VNO22_18845 [Planctomycetota bacterium]|jgi:RNA polymerase sigma-70 factor (ECF subfamily)|nr:hypothetical protein [Planctomycetota bacterium]
MEPWRRNAGDTSMGAGAADFPKTSWSLVARAADASDPARRSALEDLCRDYWRPIYRHFRVAWSRSNEEAKDLTQAFFLWLLEGETLRRYAPEKGSFRAFLKALLRHFVQNHDQAMSRLKRGGGARPIPLDPEIAGDLADPRSDGPGDAFDAEWRRTVFARALDRVRARFAQAPLKLQIYEAYDLAPASRRPTYPALAERFRLAESDVRNFLFAVRQALRSEVRAELARTASDSAELEEEWNAFLGS